MQRTREWTGRRMWAVMALLAGCGGQFGLLPSCRGALTTVNPCGTIFGFCEPSDIDLLFTDVPDYEYDPTCTIPGFGFVADPGEVPSGACADQPIYPNSPGNQP